MELMALCGTILAMGHEGLQVFTARLSSLETALQLTNVIDA